MSVWKVSQNLPSFELAEAKARGSNSRARRVRLQFPPETFYGPEHSNQFTHKFKIQVHTLQHSSTHPAPPPLIREVTNGSMPSELICCELLLIESM